MHDMRRGRAHRQGQATCSAAMAWDLAHRHAAYSRALANGNRVLKECMQDSAALFPLLGNPRRIRLRAGSDAPHAGIAMNLVGAALAAPTMSEAVR